MFQFYDNNAMHFNCCFLFFGICEFIIAFIADIRHSLKRFDAEIWDSVVFGTHRTSSELYYRLKHSFHGIIKFHMDIKQLGGASCTKNAAKCQVIFIVRIRFHLTRTVDWPTTASRSIAAYCSPSSRAVYIIGVLFCCSLTW